MPLARGRDSAIAVVGDGFGSLVVYSTAVYLGFKPSDVTIYGTNDNPVATYQQFAYNLGQTVLRSESESHFLPADWPTFAQLNAWAHRKPSLLWRTISRKYNPGVPEILSEARVVQQRLGWNEARLPVRIGWVQREMSPTPHFVLYDEDANFVGRAKHVMLALGHGPLSFPPVLAKARDNPELRDRVVQSYESKQYSAGGRYVILGAGIASINEWANALDAGAKVLALTRNPFPETQDLNVPRCLFEAQGIDVYTSLDIEQRLQFLGQVLRGTAPKRRSWLERVENGRADGRFDAAIGEIDEVEPGAAGLRIHVSSAHGEDPGWLDVTGVVAATGFNKSALTIPLLRRLVQHYNLSLEEGKIRLLTNCGIAGLDLPESRISLMGLTANSVIPHGDTIAGLKYIGRRFVADCFRAERPPPRRFPGRLAMQIKLGRQASRSLRQIKATEQLAYMCPTTLGRLQTRTIILVGPAIMATIVSLLTDNEGYIVLIGIYLMMGVLLDIFFYSFIISWQPPWLTFVLAIEEFVILYVIGKAVAVGLTPINAVWLYWASWVIAIVTKIVVLPIMSLSWIENGGELRTTGWTIQPQYVPVEIGIAGPETATGTPRLAIEFSSVREVPAELRNLPAPSGVRRRPAGIEA